MSEPWRIDPRSQPPERLAADGVDRLRQIAALELIQADAWKLKEAQHTLDEARRLLRCSVHAGLDTGGLTWSQVASLLDVSAGQAESMFGPLTNLYE